MRVLSWTQISTLMRCGQQYDYIYMQGMRRAPGIAAYRGRGTDASVNYNMDYKIQHDMQAAPRDEVSDIARDTVAIEIEREGALLTPEEQGRGLKVVVGETKDAAARLSLLHYDVLAPKIIPVTVQEKWTLDFPSRGIQLTGRLDIRTHRGIRDTKTVGKKGRVPDADRSDQLTMYATAHRIIYGKLPEELALDCLIDKGKGESLQIETTRTEADCERLIRRIDAAVKVIDSGAFMPADRSSWQCSPKYCGFYDICPYCS